MSKVEYSSNLDIKTFLSRFKTNELEEFMKEINNILQRRNKKSKKAKEAELIYRLNEVCILPEKELQRFVELSKKLKQEGLNSDENKEYFQLVENEEQLQFERIQLLGELADLRSVSLQQITKDLGIKSSQYSN